MVPAAKMAVANTAAFGPSNSPDVDGLIGERLAVIFFETIGENSNCGPSEQLG
jgi:hypothetical protein